MYWHECESLERACSSICAVWNRKFSWALLIQNPRLTAESNQRAPAYGQLLHISGMVALGLLRAQSRTAFESRFHDSSVVEHLLGKCEVARSTHARIGGEFSVYIVSGSLGHFMKTAD